MTMAKYRHALRAQGVTEVGCGTRAAGDVNRGPPSPARRHQRTPALIRDAAWVQQQQQLQQQHLQLQVLQLQVLQQQQLQQQQLQEQQSSQ